MPGQKRRSVLEALQKAGHESAAGSVQTSHCAAYWTDDPRGLVSAAAFGDRRRLVGFWIEASWLDHTAAS